MRRSWLAAVVTASIMMSGLSGNGISWADRKTTVTDTAGRRVEVPSPPARIICLSPGALRQICYLGEADKVVGVESLEKSRPMGRPYWLAHPELASLPVIGPGGPKSINEEPDLEAVLKVKPDVIFVTYMQSSKADELQKKLGIPVVVLTYGRLEQFDEAVYDSLRVAGKALKKEGRAEEIVAFARACQSDLQKKTEGFDSAKRPTVFAGAVGFKGTQGIESTDANYAPLEWVGADNVAKRSGKQGHLFVTKEQLLAWDPEIIFIDGGGLSLVRQDFERKPDFYRALRAVKNGRVYLLLPFNWYMTNVCTTILDAYAVGKVLHPDRFADIDLKRKADEVYTFFVGKPVHEQMERDFGELGSPVSLGP